MIQNYLIKLKFHHNICEIAKQFDTSKNINWMEHGERKEYRLLWQEEKILLVMVCVCVQER